MCGHLSMILDIMKNPVLSSAIFCLVVIMLSSWGYLVHRTVNQLAVYQLPSGLRAFFYVHMDYIVKHSIRPDLRKNEDSTEDAKHFINLETFGDSAAWRMPETWDQAVRLYSLDSLLENGYLPYYIITMKNRLANAFKIRNKDSILYYATDLAHYIADAHVPLHTTINYDGQLTDQKGLHSLWETMIPEIQLNQYNLSSSHKAKYLKKPEDAVWRALRNSHALIAEVIRQEKETSKQIPDTVKYRTQLRRGKEVKTYSPVFANAYNKRLGSTINNQLIQSANMIADFWYTCWVDGGKPNAKDLPGFQVAENKREMLNKECKAYKANKLITEKLLIARQR
jgi:hypothetical protein